MTTVQIYQRPQVEVPASVTSSERGLILAFNDKRISECTKLEVVRKLEDLIMKSFFNGGFKRNTQEDRALMEDTILANDCFLFLVERHKNLTLSELNIIFNNGSRGIYGDNHGINPTAFTRWVNGYLSSKEVEDAKEQYGQLLKKANEEKYLKKVVSNEEFTEAWRKFFITRLKELFEAHKAKGILNDMEASLYFSRLYKERIIVLTEEVREDLKSKALKIVFSRLENKKAANPQMRNKVRSEVDQLIQSGTADEKVINYAKYLGLLYWFDSLIEFEMSIEEVLSQEF